MQILICNIDNTQVSIFLLLAVVFQCNIFIGGGGKKQVISVLTLICFPSFQSGYLKRFPP